MNDTTDCGGAKIDPLHILETDRNAKLYRPELRYLAGSVTGALLLSQMIYWSRKVNHRPFYKFSAPCSHDQYTPGQSWQEELNFTRYEFEGARQKVATKIGPGDSKEEALKTSLVVYWRDGDNLTWYELNTGLLNLLLAVLYEAIAENQHSEAIAENLQSAWKAIVENPHSVREANAENPHSEPGANAENPHSIWNAENQQSIESETTTKTTQTKTTRGAGAANAPPAGTPTEPAGEQLEPNQSAVEPDAAFEAPPPTPPSSAPPPAPPSATSLVKDAWAWALAHREDKAALRDLLDQERAGQDRPTLTSSLEALIAAGPDEAVALRSPAQRAQDEMVEALAELTHETKTPEQFEALSSSAQSNLRRAASAFRDQGRTPAQVRAFKRWWYEVRFKGKSDATPPSLRQVKNQWFGAMKWQERTTNSAADAQDYSPKKPKKGVRVDLRHAAPTNVA